MLYPERERRVLLVLVLVLASLLIYVSLGWNGRYNGAFFLMWERARLFLPLSLCLGLCACFVFFLFFSGVGVGVGRLSVSGEGHCASHVGLYVSVRVPV